MSFNTAFVPKVLLTPLILGSLVYPLPGKLIFNFDIGPRALSEVVL